MEKITIKDLITELDEPMEYDRLGNSEMKKVSDIIWMEKDDIEKWLK